MTHSSSTPPKTPSRRLQGLRLSLLLAFPLGLIAAWAGLFEMAEYHDARVQVVQSAEGGARTYAQRVSDVLDRGLASLRVVAQADSVERARGRLDRYRPLNPELQGLVVRAEAPAAAGVGFHHALPDAQSAFFGPVRQGAEISAAILPVRYVALDRGYVVSGHFVLPGVSRNGNTSARWPLRLVDAGEGGVAIHTDRGRSVPLRGYPLAVQANWAPDRVWKRYVESARPRWLLEALTFLVFLLFGVTAWRMVRLNRARERDTRRLGRLAKFNAVHAQVNQVMSRVDCEGALFEQLCDLAVRYGGLRLAWIGKPDAQGDFQVLAAAGETGYLQSNIISVDEERPEGRGPAGNAWRQGRAVYNESLGAPSTEPWRQRAERYGLVASATLPIHRSSRIWAVLSVYHGDAGAFDSDLRILMEELAEDVSLGLDRLDAAARERQLQQALSDAHDYHQALFEHNATGICTLDENRTIADVNGAMCEMLGYEMAELVGRNTEFLHPSADAYRAFEPDFAPSPKGAPVARQEGRLKRKDGSTLWVQMLGARIALSDGTPGVLWSFIDVTALHEARQEITYQALHDVLTGLPNRRGLEQQLPRAIARARRNDTAVAVGMIDLDDFKAVNDTDGHEAGDRLLRTLADRLREKLRAGDMLARPGGDEFVLLLEDLDRRQATKQLEVAFRRLHEAVETPFETAPGRSARIGMSMGVAIFPFDADDGDALLRQADTAMYHAKKHKAERLEWWRLGAESASQPEQEPSFDAYGRDAVELLDKVGDKLSEVTRAFVDAFYAELWEEPEARAILNALGPVDLPSLKAKQVEHLEFLLDASSTRATIKEQAERIGRIHALVGLSTAMLTRSLALYRRLLSEHLNKALMPARERYRILLAADVRLQDDIQSELEIFDNTVGEYYQAPLAPLPSPGALWVDARATELARMGQLPGVRAVLLMRPDTAGVFTVEETAGPVGAEVAAVLQTPGSQAVLSPDSPRGQGLTSVAWRTLEVQSCASYAADERYRFWHPKAEELGLRSTLSIPVVDDSGHAVAVVSFFGAYTNQFESQWMRQVASSLQQRWSQVWYRCSSPAAPMPQDRAQALRQRLFDGGLRMYVQPIVDLGSGEITRAEALARLELADGEVVSPGLFLPLLGDSELDMLFRSGLAIALDGLRRWEAVGLNVDLALNLSPGTLLDPDCPRWVETALKRAGIPPERLTLELLETRGLGSLDRDEAIERLVATGACLAMDDLGSGYSSLQRLASVPFNVIKVDQELLARVHVTPIQTLSLIRAIIQMGRDFDRQVVVEGLEHPGLIEAAAILGARYGQGYGIARPMPAAELPRWASSFRLEYRPGEIRTLIGALAFHWQFLHDGKLHEKSPVAECPLHAFLQRLGPEGEEPSKWHACVHEQSDVHHCSGELLDWLENRVKEDGEAMSAAVGL